LAFVALKLGPCIGGTKIFMIMREIHGRLIIKYTTTFPKSKEKSSKADVDNNDNNEAFRRTTTIQIYLNMCPRSLSLLSSLQTKPERMFSLSALGHIDR